MTIQEIQGRLFALQDIPYRDFTRRLIPNIPPETILGIRTPHMKALAKEICISGDYSDFLATLPHTYYEENNLHSFIIGQIKDFNSCVEALDRFLPFVDNWATCDGINPGVFQKKREELLTHISRWLVSEHPYTVRFGIRMLMNHFLEDAFLPQYPEMVAQIRSEEYYVNMMIAWYFATALAKQYEAVLPYLENRRLDPWVHRKAIQKACESYRISGEQKDYLRTLK